MKELYKEIKEIEEKAEAFEYILNHLLTNEKVSEVLILEDFEKLKKYFKIIGRTQAWGKCPFPNQCNQYNNCTAISCNADFCSIDGYVYKDTKPPIKDWRKYEL
jgi:hypothetical protein